MTPAKIRERLADLNHAKTNIDRIISRRHTCPLDWDWLVAMIGYGAHRIEEVRLEDLGSASDQSVPRKGDV